MHAATLAIVSHDGARLRAIPGRFTRTVRIHAGPLSAVLVLHAAVITLVVAFPGETFPPQATDESVPVLVRPEILITDDASLASASRRRHRRPSPIAILEPTRVFAPPVITSIGIGTMPPRLEGEAIDSAPYARAAGLAAGTGATVVLRLEILDSGEVGRVEVEVSGGADAIDQAAIAYVRVLPWAGGMIDGRPASMWIRWGVRLQSQLVNGLKQRR